MTSFSSVPYCSEKSCSKCLKNKYSLGMPLRIFFLPQERKKNIFRVNLKLSLLKNRWFGYFTNKVTFKQGLPSLLPPPGATWFEGKLQTILKQARFVCDEGSAGASLTSVPFFTSTRPKRSESLA